MKKILVVDDDDVIHELLQDICQGEGWEVVTHKRAEDALTCLENGHSFDVIFSDVNMPGMDGIEFRRQVKAIGCQSCFVFMTGRVDQQNLDAIEEVGCDDTIFKPFGQAQFIAKVTALDKE